MVTRSLASASAVLFGALLLGSGAGVTSCADDAAGGGGTSDAGPAATTGAPVRPSGSCDDIDVCEGDGTTPSSGCVECSVLDDGTFALDGGACRDEYVGCFGPEGDCSDGHPDCCAFFDCLLACPEDDPGTATDEYFDCICDNDGTNCFVEQPESTCLGAEPLGGQRYVDWVTCAFVDVCPGACE
jgi:hypothetical protein